VYVPFWLLPVVPLSTWCCSFWSRRSGCSASCSAARAVDAASRVADFGARKVW